MEQQRIHPSLNISLEQARRVWPLHTITVDGDEWVIEARDEGTTWYGTEYLSVIAARTISIVFPGDLHVTEKRIYAQFLEEWAATYA